jgi:hypothetical protein
MFFAVRDEKLSSIAHPIEHRSKMQKFDPDMPIPSMVASEEVPGRTRMWRKITSDAPERPRG